jgi:hypothetical protein
MASSTPKKTKQSFIHIGLQCFIELSHPYTRGRECVFYLVAGKAERVVGLKLPMGGLNFTRREAVN